MRSVSHAHDVAGLLCLAATIVLMAGLSACTSHSGDSSSGQTTESQDSGAVSSNGDPCTLLSASEVATAIGPLAGAPYRGNPVPDESSDVCRYDTQDNRRLLVSVDWTGGKLVMKMMAFSRALTDRALQAETKIGTVLKSGDTLRGSWDQVAATPAACCSLDALKGDQHVQLDWAGTRLTVAAAGALLDSAIVRLNHPLSVDGTAGIASATQRLATLAQDSALDACSLVSQSAASAIIGVALSGPPDHGDPGSTATQTSCYYRAPMPNTPNLPLVYQIDVKAWNDAHAEFAEDQSLIHGAITGLRRQLTGDSAAPAQPADPPGPWDEIGPSDNGGYEAVKGPLLLLGSTTGDPARLRTLLAAAVTALH